MTIRPLIAIPATLAAVLAAALLATQALPSTARVERTADIAASPEVLRGLIASSEGFQRFNPFREQDPTIRIDMSGPDRGVGARFAWTSGSGGGSQTVIHDEPQQVVMQLDLGRKGRPLQTFTLQPSATGTVVTWSLDADLGRNPIARIAGLFLERQLGGLYENGLQALARASGGESQQAAAKP